VFALACAGPAAGSPFATNAGSPHRKVLPELPAPIVTEREVFSNAVAFLPDHELITGGGNGGVRH
jgi:hypothetical protein